MAEPLLGNSLVRLLYEKPENRFEPFDRVIYTHPAVFLLNFSLAKALQEEGVVPACLVGYSLGETAAWTVAGALTLEQALGFVIQTARLIEQRTPPGGMLAVLGPISLWETNPEVFAGATRAGLNYEEHFVIAGPESNLRRVRALLKAQGVCCQPLPIKQGFHSPLLDEIEPSLRSLAAQLTIGTAQLPVVSCMAGRALLSTDLGPQYWWDVLRRPVQFSEAMRALETSAGPHFYVDVGPSGTLAGFIKNLTNKHPDSEAMPVLTPFGQDLRGLTRLKAALNQ